MKCKNLLVSQDQFTEVAHALEAGTSEQMKMLKALEQLATFKAQSDEAMSAKEKAIDLDRQRARTTTKMFRAGKLGAIDDALEPDYDEHADDATDDNNQDTTNNSNRTKQKRVVPVNRTARTTSAASASGASRSAGGGVNVKGEPMDVEASGSDMNENSSSTASGASAGGAANAIGPPADQPEASADKLEKELRTRLVQIKEEERLYAPPLTFHLHYSFILLCFKLFFSLANHHLTYF